VAKAKQGGVRAGKGERGAHHPAAGKARGSVNSKWGLEVRTEEGRAIKVLVPGGGAD
jgi:hypothetical protein